MLMDFDLVLILLGIQILLGGFDNLWHHELTEALPGRLSARREISLHAARELIYAGVFLTLAWTQPGGVLAWVFGAILLLEIGITLADFIEEDRTRTLPALERVLHTVLALNYGAILVLLLPYLAEWAGRPTGITLVEHGWWSPVLTVCAVGVFAWGVRDTIAGVTLYRRARQTGPAAEPPESGRVVLVTGGTGFIGQIFVRRRLARGDRVIVLSRDPRKARALFGGRADVVTDLDLIAPATRIDAIINLAGARVADLPWWPARRRVLLDSRLEVTRAIIRLVARLQTRPDVLVNASAIGAYGDRGETPLPEHASRPLGVFTADLCRVWEMEAERARRLGVRVCILRFGLVLGRDDGVFPRLVMTRPLGVLPQFGDGRQWMGWVHVDDALGVLDRALDDRRMAGPFNVVAPGGARHGEVIRALAGPRLVLPVPAALLKLGLGEMAQLFLASQKVVPERLERLHHAFRYPDMESAATALLDAPRAPDEETGCDAPAMGVEG